MLLAAGLASAQQQQLVIERDWSSVSTFYRDCVQVMNDGSYRFEHSSISSQEPRSLQIHAGKFSEDEMKQFEAMLDDPALAPLTTPMLNRQQMTLGTDIDTFWVGITRGDNAQLLFFDSTSSSGKKYSSEQFPSLYRTAAMKPLLEWYKQMGKRKGDVDKKATSTCSFQVRSQVRPPLK